MMDNANEAWVALLKHALDDARKDSSASDVVDLPVERERVGDAVISQALNRAKERSPTLRAASTQSVDFDCDDSTHCFRIIPICETNVGEIVNLTRQGDSLLVRKSSRSVVDACANHDGLLIRGADGGVVGSCFVSHLTLPLDRATHRSRDVQAVTYLHSLVVAKTHRNRGLGGVLLRATIAYQFGRWDGQFPDVVGVAQQDKEIPSAAAVGVHRFSQASFATSVHRTMLAIDTMVRGGKDFDDSRGIEFQILEMERMPAIARWALDAYGPQGVRDDDHGTIIRMIDPSAGRSGIIRELQNLANAQPHALGRLCDTGSLMRA